jgi:hypothetical protein
VYLTLGNIPRATRRKPSEHASILIAYLSTSKIQNKNLTIEERKNRVLRLFHDSMRLVLQPLINAGRQGVEMHCADGNKRRIHPILATYVADYPEQCLVACSKYGTCPKCQRPAEDLQNKAPGNPRDPKHTLAIIQEANVLRQTKSLSSGNNHCLSNNLAAAANNPFWEDFPLTNIHASITPDVLHQLYQGVLKHLISWCQAIMTEEEMDRCLRTLPPAHGVHHFKNGISALSQVSGQERKDMAKVLLGCLVNAKIPHGVLRSAKAILDFIYLAQYPSHDDTTLSYMADALKAFTKDRDIFIKVGARKDFNLPKLHSLLHYIDAIQDFGTTDNYNTEMFERLHIDFAKEGWRASNHRDERPQMIKWLERREKVVAFESYVKDTNGESANPVLTNISGHAIQLTKNPHQKNQPILLVEQLHDCMGSFQLALKKFINQLSSNIMNRQQLQHSLLPITHINIYHCFKLSPPTLNEDRAEKEIIRATPSRKQAPTPRFDTVVVVNDDQREEAETTGLRGMFKYCI